MACELMIKNIADTYKDIFNDDTIIDDFDIEIWGNRKEVIFAQFKTDMGVKFVRTSIFI